MELRPRGRPVLQPEPQHGVCDGSVAGKGLGVSAAAKQEAEVAVAELRLFISLYEDAELVRGSRTAKQLEAARRAVSAYDEVEKLLADDAA